jgi:hypothetical protein
VSLSQAAAAALAAFPPRGGIALLPPEATGGGRPAMDRLIAQDYIIDSMLYFDGDRVESAVRLASGAQASNFNPTLGHQHTWLSSVVMPGGPQLLSGVGRRS